MFDNNINYLKKQAIFRLSVFFILAIVIGFLWVDVITSVPNSTVLF